MLHQELDERIKESSIELKKLNELLPQETNKRKQAEEELRKSERSLAEARRIAHLGNWYWDIVNNELRWSDEIYRIFGLEPQLFEATYESFLASVHPDDRDDLKKAVDEALNKKKPFDIDHRIIRPDGLVRIVHGKAEVSFDAAGKPVRMIGTVQDITDRKQVDNALKESEERLKAVWNSMHTGIIIVDQKNRIIVDLNPVAVKMIGVPRNEVIGKSCHNYLCPDGEKQASITNAGRKADGEERALITGSGIRVPILKTVAPVVLSGRKHFLVSFIDNTRQKQVEQEIRLRNQFLENILESLTHPFLVIDINNYKILKANSPSNLFGDLQKDVFCYTFSHHNSVPCGIGENNCRCPIEEVKRTKKPATVEHLHYDKEGKQIYFEVHCYPIFDSEGNLVQAIEYSLDSTDRKQAEALLSKSEREKKLVLDSMSEILIYYDINMNILWANKAALKAADLEPCQVISAHCYEIWCKRDRSCSDCPVTKTRETGEFQEAEIDTLDGKVGLVRGYPVKDAEKRLVGIVETVLDITNQKKAEKEKNNIQAQLIQAQKMEAVGRLAGGVAHDFNNILTTIIGFSDLIMMEYKLDESVQESILEIKSSANRAASLTQQLLAFSRKQVLQPKVIHLNELINTIKKMLQRLIGEDIFLETKLDPETGFIKVDPGKMEQVIMNLAVNSRDAMPDGGKIILETHSVYLDEDYCHQKSEIKPGNYIMLTVSDTGLGMNEETKKRIFEPFFTTKEVGKGTGLGLSTVYGVVKQSRGFIYVYSELNEGTTFKIYLPETKRHRKKKIQFRRPNNTGTGSETILLVEDDTSLRKIAGKMLRRSGYTIYEAASGGEALKIIEGDKKPTIDLLITDVIMPAANGRELSEKVLKKYPDIKVLFMSGYTDDAIVHHGVLDEGVFFLSKPFSSLDLRQKVREVLDRKRNRHEG